MRRLLFGLRLGDVAVVVLVLMLAAGASVLGWAYDTSSAGSSQGEMVMVVRADGREALVVPVGHGRSAERHEVAGPLGITVVEIGPDGAKIVDSPCRDKLCMTRGGVSQPGQTAVCLPNRVSIEIVARDGQQFDTLSY